MNTKSSSYTSSNAAPIQPAIIDALEPESKRDYLQIGLPHIKSSPSYPEVRKAIVKLLRASDELYSMLR